MEKPQGAPKYRVGNDKDGFVQTDRPRSTSPGPNGASKSVLTGSTKKAPIPPMLDKVGQPQWKPAKMIEPGGIMGSPPRDIPRPGSEEVSHGTHGQQFAPKDSTRRVHHSPTMTEYDHQKDGGYKCESLNKPSSKKGY